MRNLCTRKGFEIKTGDQVDDVKSQPHLSMDNPGVCFSLYHLRKLGLGQ